MKKPRLLIVDDDEGICSQMKWALGRDYEVLVAHDRPSAVHAFREHSPQAVLLDLGLPPRPGSTEEGFAALTEILSRDSLARVIIVSGQNETESALQAIGAGAYDFLNKPVQLDELRVILKRIFHVAALEKN
jgi:two-component system NtrC family response regulator